MQTRQLGNSDLQITPLGVGAWAIGGGGMPFAWGPQDDGDSIGAIHAALDRGINWIDTAPIYGLGHSEDVVGRALKGRSKRPYVFTKCSIVWDNKREVTRNLKRDSIRRECEESLRRLGIDAIDLYQLHWPDPEPDIEEGWRTLVELRKEGKIRWMGVSNFKPAQLARDSLASICRCGRLPLWTDWSRFPEAIRLLPIPNHAHWMSAQDS